MPNNPNLQELQHQLFLLIQEQKRFNFAMRRFLTNAESLSGELKQLEGSLDMIQTNLLASSTPQEAINMSKKIFLFLICGIP